MGAMRTLSLTLVWCAAVSFFAASAQAAPLGLVYGDEVSIIEWDAFQSVPGDGGIHDPDLWGTGLAGVAMDGRVNSVSGTNSGTGDFTNPVTNSKQHANSNRSDTGYCTGNSFGYRNRNIFLGWQRVETVLTSGSC